ncbi:MAG: YvcK family protein [bacterium]|nr:YvcK family protein [bacterium]
MKKRPKIVVIGGGTGTYQVLVGLKEYPVDFDLTAVITMSDSGGSSGKLRKEFGILPPGDVRRALLALSNLPISKKTLAKLFEFRFDPSTSSGLAGHSMGNLLLAALTQIYGREDLAISECEKILDVSGHVLPVTLAKTNLHGVLTDGTIVRGETNIDVRRIKPSVPIREVYLKPVAQIYPKAREAICSADLVILGPGDLYTSIVPNLLVEGVNEAIQKSKAQLVYICNLMTKHGETDGFSAQDFVSEIKKYLKGSAEKLAYVLVNEKTSLAPQVKGWYKEYHSQPVEDGLDGRANGIKVIHDNFARAGKLVRHDPEKLARTIVKLL